MTLSNDHHPDDHPDDAALIQYRIACQAGKKGTCFGWQREPPPLEPRLAVKALSGPLDIQVRLESIPGGCRVWEVAVGSVELADRWRAEIESERNLLEGQWWADLLWWNMVDLQVDSPHLTLTVYPGTVMEFRRVIDVRLHLLSPPDEPDAYALDCEVPAVVVYVDRPRRWWSRIPLDGLIWR